MYIYIIKKKLEKNDKFKNYIPVILGVNEDINNYKNKKVLILNNNDIHGYLKICKLISNKCNEYDKLLKSLKFIELECLYFIEYNELVKFDRIIKKTEINKILDVKIKTNVDNYTLNEYSGKDLLKTIIREINKKISHDEDEDEDEDEDDDEDEDEDEDEEDEEEEEDINKINLGIPILWKICSEIEKIIMDDKKMKKTTINGHICGCKECEIINNRNNQIDMTKNFVFSKANNNTEKIIDCYERCIDYKETEDEIKIFKDIDKTALIYEDNETYGKIIIII
jgi:hypothetical protein